MPLELCWRIQVRILTCPIWSDRLAGHRDGRQGRVDIGHEWSFVKVKAGDKRFELHMKE